MGVEKNLIQWITSFNSSYPLERFRKEPVEWLDWIGFDTWWDKQKEVIESVRDNQRTAVRSGHTVGKTKIAAGTMLWFQFNFFPSRVISTAPTGRQVSLLLWGEIRRLYRQMMLKIKREFGIAMGARLFDTDYLEIYKKLWYGIGYSTDEVEAFTGSHEINILFVVDEGSGVKEGIFEGIETSLNSPNSKVLTIGNPTNLGSYFGKIFLTKEGRDWNKIHIDCEESPNVLAGKNIIPGLCNYDWPEKMARKWGREDSRFLIRVKGNFVEEGINCLVNYQKAYSAYVENLELYKESELVLAMDVAREGDDTTVILLREKCIRDERLWIEEDIEKKGGEWEDTRERDNGSGDSVSDNDTEGLLFGLSGKKERSRETRSVCSYNEEHNEEIGAKIIKKIPKHKTMDAVAEIVILVKENSNIKEICIDVVGVGAGVYDRLVEIKESGEMEKFNDIEIYAVNVGESALDKGNYMNLRAELANEVKKEIDNETLLYNNEDIVDQVSQIRYKYHSKGHLVLEPKEEFKRRYKRSPDELDALMISFASRILKLKSAEPRIRFV